MYPWNYTSFTNDMFPIALPYIKAVLCHCHFPITSSVKEATASYSTLNFFYKPLILIGTILLK